MAFPDLLLYLKDLQKRRKPDAFLIEKKASGHSIIQELRRQGIPCIEFNPDRDKVARAWAATPVFEAGRVWMKKSMHFAQVVMEELESFPNGEHDDLVDSVVQAVLWLRKSRIGVSDPTEDKPLKQKKIFSYWQVPKANQY